MKQPYGPREYENWHNSRWEFTKKRSKWHFDPSRSPQPGADSYTLVCRFDGDFNFAISQCMKRVQPASWATRNYVSAGPLEKRERMYSADAEETDLLRAGADPKMELFDRAQAEDIPVFQKIVEHLGLEDCSVKFHNQRTGQMIVEHIDNFAGRYERGNSFKVTKMDKNPDLMRRFIIFLDDWKLGQVMQFGNATISQWNCGDCITWDWINIPHATANMGWEDRPILQLTGKVTARTDEVLKNPDDNRIVKID
jgi:hypothetical protein